MVGIHNRIPALCVVDYHLNEKSKIIGDFENHESPHIIILYTKKIFNYNFESKISNVSQYEAGFPL